MRVTGIQTYQNQNRNQKPNFGMAVHMPKSMQEYAREAVSKRVVDPIEWFSTILTLAEDKAVYTIMKEKKSTSIFSSPNIIITRQYPGEEFQSVVTKMGGDFFEAINRLVPELKQRNIMGKQFLENSMMNGLDAISSSQPKDFLPPATPVTTTLGQAIASAMKQNGKLLGNG